MKTKTGAAKGVRLPAHPKVDLLAHEKLPDNPSVEELKTAAVTISLADLEERVADVRDSWEEDSLFEEVIEELTDDGVAATGGEFQTVLIHCDGLLSIFTLLPRLGISQVGGFWWVCCCATNGRVASRSRVTIACLRAIGKPTNAASCVALSLITIRLHFQILDPPSRTSLKQTRFLLQSLS